MKSKSTRLILLLILLSTFQFNSFSKSKKEQKTDEKNLVKATMFPMETSLLARRPTFLGFHFKIKPGWHIYWKNPGDSGLETQIEIDSANNFTRGAIVWQIPEIVQDGNITNYGYSGECLLRVPIYCSHLLKYGDSIKIKAKVKWLVCKEKCIAGEFQDSVVLKVEDKQPVMNDIWKKLAGNDPRDDIMQFFNYWKYQAKYEGKKLIISFDTKDSKADFSKLHFIPEENGIICNSCTQKF